MKGKLTLKKLAVIAAVCMAVLCLLVYSEPTPEQVKERTNLLIQAINKNDVEQAKLCIKLGADVNTKVYRTYWSPIVYVGNTKDCYTALTYAVCINSKDMVELLIDAGVDVNLRDDEGNTALMYAAFNGYRDMAELLIKAGADVNAKILLKNRIVLYLDQRKDLGGSNILLLAVKKEENYKNDIVKLLIESGADVNAKDYDGDTALRIAALHNKKDIAELLIEAGADLNVKNNAGRTALRAAAGEGNRDITELLIKAGADMDVKGSDGLTALICAIDNDKKDTAELLIKAGADSETALAWAVENNKHDAVKFLIELGTDVNSKDKDGLTLLTHAILHGQKDIADLLRAAGAKE